MDPHSLVTAFTVWAAVVALVGGAIVWELSRLRLRFDQLSEYIGSLARELEHRITAAEGDIKSLRRDMDSRGFRPYPNEDS